MGMEFPKGMYFDPNSKYRVEKNQIIYIVNSSRLEYVIDAENLRYATMHKEASYWTTSIKKFLLHPQKYQPVIVQANEIPGSSDRVAVTDDDGTIYFPIKDVMGREVGRIIPEDKGWGRCISYPNQPDIDRGKLVIKCGDIVTGTVDFIVPEGEDEWRTTLGGDVNANYLVNNDLKVMIQKSTIVQPENAGLHPNESIDIIQIKDLEDHQGVGEQMSLEEIARIYILELPGHNSTTVNPFLSNDLHTRGGCCLLI